MPKAPFPFRGPPEPPSQPPAPAGGSPTIYSVSGITRRLRAELERSYPRVLVGGEISNLTIHGVSGHAYFTLKDSGAQLRCVMWRDDLSRLAFKLGDGMEVIVGGRVTVYERSGQLQLSVASVRQAGRGRYEEAFRKLAEKLRAEGLTAPERKRPIPPYPTCVGVVTSRDGAALRDVLRTILRRDPYVRVVIAWTPVQGPGAGPEIADAIRRLDRLGVAELILLARGGGSVEDLWAFNEEPVARAIVSASVPVVTGIGHETDQTIADLVSDLSASTPTAAAERAVPVRAEMLARFKTLSNRLHRAMGATAARLSRRLFALEAKLRDQDPKAVLGRRRQRIDELITRAERALHLRHKRRQQSLTALEKRLARLDPVRRLEAQRSRLTLLSARRDHAIRRAIERARRRLEVGAMRLESLSPVKVLARGFAVVSTEDGRVVRASTEVSPGDRVSIRLSEGSLSATVDWSGPRARSAPPGEPAQGEQAKRAAGEARVDEDSTKP